MSRRLLDEARAAEPLPIPASSTAPAGEPALPQPDNAGSERTVLYEQVLEGLHRLDAGKPRRTLTEFHDWFTPAVASGEPSPADEVPGPAPEAGGVPC